MIERKPQEEPRVEDLDVPESESHEVKGGAAFDGFLEIDGVKDETSLKQKGATKWGDIVLKRG